MFSSSNRLHALVARFLAAGVINTVVGFSVIIVLMLMGIDAITSNIAGYAIGLLLSFTLNRQFVFLAHGKVSREFATFLVAFGVSFGANLACLQLLITRLAVSPFAAQVVAAAVYSCLMFVICRYFVFSADGKA